MTDDDINDAINRAMQRLSKADRDRAMYDLATYGVVGIEFVDGTYRYVSFDEMLEIRRDAIGETMQ